MELDQIRPILVSHFWHFWLGQYGKAKRGEEKKWRKKKKKKKKKRKGMDHYVFVTLSMEKYDLYGLYGGVCMKISGSIARVLIRIH